MLPLPFSRARQLVLEIARWSLLLARKARAFVASSHRLLREPAPVASDQRPWRLRMALAVVLLRAAELPPASAEPVDLPPVCSVWTVLVPAAPGLRRPLSRVQQALAPPVPRGGAPSSAVCQLVFLAPSLELGSAELAFVALFLRFVVALVLVPARAFLLHSRLGLALVEPLRRL